MIEPVFADLKFNRKINRFQRRGRSAARSEWRLPAATHSLLTSTTTAQPPQRPENGLRDANRPDYRRPPHQRGTRWPHRRTFTRQPPHNPAELLAFGCTRTFCAIAASPQADRHRSNSEPWRLV
jgi:hypothetical protein